MSTDIRELKKTTKAQNEKIEVEKVSLLLRMRYKKRKAREKLSGTVDSLAVSLDPRANQEDYLRRRQRLQELVKATRSDPSYANLKDVTSALDEAEVTIGKTDTVVNSAQTKGDRPDYGGQRDVLSKASKKLDVALAKADKLFDKIDKKDPDLAQKLDAIARAIDNPQLAASAELVTKWRGQYKQASAAFYSEKQSPKIGVVIGLLHGQMQEEVKQNRARMETIKNTCAELTQRSLTCGLPIDQVAPINDLITRAGREAATLDFTAADKLLLQATQLLPIGPVAKPPSMDAVETARLSLKRAALATLDVKPGEQPPQGVASVVSEPGRKRVVDLLHRLDELAPLCQQTEEGVAVEAMRRVTACEEDYRKICDADKGIKDFLDEKQSTGDHIQETIARLRKELAKRPATGAAIQFDARLTELETSFNTTWSTLMSADELDNSGLLLTTTTLVEEFDEWKKAPVVTGPQDWKQEFFAAGDRLRQVTEQAKQKNIGLLKQFGLVSAMPALVLKGGSLITGGAQTAEADVRKITGDLIRTVNLVTSNLEQMKPETLEKLIVEGDRLIEDYTGRINKQLKTLEDLKPGKKQETAQNFVKFFKSDAFGDDAERSLRITYGGSLNETLKGLGALLRCKDPTAVQSALDEIKNFASKITDFEAMGETVVKPGNKQGAPPNFAELLKRLKEIKAEIEQQAKSNLKTRPDTIKEWTTEMDAIAEEVGEADPRELIARIGVLEREIVTKTQSIKLDVNKSKVQLAAILELLIKLKDAGKKGSRTVKDFGPLLAELNRKGEAMRGAVERWEVEDAGFADWKKEVDSLLNGSRPKAETESLTDKSKTADAENKKVQAARKDLMKLRDADLKLWKEKFEKIGNEEKKTALLKLVEDLSKEVDRTIDGLAEGRDADGATALIQSVLRELADASVGQGDALTARADLEKLDNGWRIAVRAVEDALGKLELAIAEAAKGTPGDDVAQAVGSVRNGLIRPVLGIFGPATFSSSIKGLMSQDATARATNREAALAEVRRIRRVIEGDIRVHMLALDNPFKVPIPFSELSSRLFDIEVNVTRARGE